MTFDATVHDPRPTSPPDEPDECERYGGHEWSRSFVVGAQRRCVWCNEPMPSELYDL
jgi:hypothetical protein